MLSKLLLLGIYLASLVMSAAVDNNRIRCVATPIRAPEEDCRAVLDMLVRDIFRDERYKQRLWGRGLVTTTEQMALPMGFQLRPMRPSQRERNHCEINVDADLSHEAQIDSFSMQAVIDFGNALIDTCYPGSESRTGYAYPGIARSVYVTTINVPGDGLGGGNYTVIQLPAAPGGNSTNIFQTMPSSVPTS